MGSGHGDWPPGNASRRKHQDNGKRDEILEKQMGSFWLQYAPVCRILVVEEWSLLADRLMTTGRLNRAKCGGENDA